MNMNLLTAMRHSKGFSRTVSYLIILALVGVLIERTIYFVLVETDVIEPESALETLYRVAPHKARQLGLPDPRKMASAKPQSNDAKLSASILKTRDTLDVLAYELHRKGGDPTKAQAELKKLHSALKEQDEKAMADFQKVGRHVEKHKLAEIIKQRHQNAVASYRKDMDTLLNNVQAALTTDDADEQLKVVMAARKHLEGKQLERSQQPFDPNNLPHKSMQPNRNNKPKLTEKAFADAGLVNNPLVQYASHGGFTYGNLAGASNPAYLAETDEVKLTDAIKARALELNHDPVKIYNWVHNNIEWIPSWGAMQDSDITLGSKRGNSMDISSLLIALYRASGIPARYVHGTIEVPAEKFRNWAGGFESTEAAADFASSGGIPTGIGIEGGVPSVVQLEHIWVEAAIDYLPSRGAINKDADSWVQIDASYKQYEFLQGLDVVAITGIDAQQIATDFTNSGTVNEAEGWVSGFDPALLQNAQQQAQTALENHIKTNLPNATVGDVIGGRKVILNNATTLPSTLPSEIKVLGVRYAKMPHQLQARVTFQLGVDAIGQPAGQITLPWAKVNNYNVTLSFRPATPDDEAVLRTMIPDGGFTDISQLPSSIPAYLVSMIPELRIGDTTVSSGASSPMGADMNFNYTMHLPTHGNITAPNRVIVGSSLNVVSVSSSVSMDKLNQLSGDLDALKTEMESGNADAVNFKDSLLKSFYVGELNYFSQFQSMNYTLGLRSKAFHGLLPSGGTFGYRPDVSYFFGVANSISTGNIELDLSNINTFTGISDGQHDKKVAYVKQVGIISSTLEHLILEEMFVNPVNTNKGISSVKAISVAAEQGQSIYQIDLTNKDDVLPKLNLTTNTMSDINAALLSGKTVITHTSTITYSGWAGDGYIILDEETGSGAYKISGGLNGGAVFLGVLFAIVLFAALVVFLFAFVAAATLLAAPAFLAIGIMMLLGALFVLSVGIAYNSVHGTASSWWDGFIIGVNWIPWLIAGALLVGLVTATAPMLLAFGILSLIYGLISGLETTIPKVKQNWPLINARLIEQMQVFRYAIQLYTLEPDRIAENYVRQYHV